MGEFFKKRSLVANNPSHHKLVLSETVTAQYSIRNSSKSPYQVSAHSSQAYMKLSEFRKSREYLTKAGRLSPGNEEIRQELLKLDR